MKTKTLLVCKQGLGSPEENALLNRGTAGDFVPVELRPALDSSMKFRYA